MSKKPLYQLPEPLQDKFIVMIGLMGAGKSNLGRRLATAMGMPFIDTDNEIETAAGCTIDEIFEQFGEREFRAGERRVIARLLRGEPAVVATGGGAFMDKETRKRVKKKAISIWLRADVELLHRRTSRRDHRPLLKKGDPKKILKDLIDARYPIYAEADIAFDVSDEPAPDSAKRVLAKLIEHCESLIEAEAT